MRISSRFPERVSAGDPVVGTGYGALHRLVAAHCSIGTTVEELMAGWPEGRPPK